MYIQIYIYRINMHQTNEDIISWYNVYIYIYWILYENVTYENTVMIIQVPNYILSHPNDQLWFGRWNNGQMLGQPHSEQRNSASNTVAGDHVNVRHLSVGFEDHLNFLDGDDGDDWWLGCCQNHQGWGGNGKLGEKAKWRLRRSFSSRLEHPSLSWLGGY